MNDRDFAAMIAYIKDNLSIEISQDTEFGPIETINVKLFLGNDLISEDSCNLSERLL